MIEQSDSDGWSGMYRMQHMRGLEQSCPRVGWTRGSGRVGSGHDFAGFWRVGSGQHFGFLGFLLISSWYESSNTAFGLIDFLRYLIYNKWIINKYLFN